MSNALSMAGADKAALVILGLDEFVAKDILRHLSDADIQRLAKSVERMANVPMEAIDPTFDEFAQRMRAPVLPSARGEYVRRLVGEAVGEERARRVLSGAPSNPTSLDLIRRAHASTLGELLQEEHPQVAAVIISQLTSTQASRVLETMPAERKTEILRRIAALHEVPLQAIEVASESVARMLSSLGELGQADARAQFDGIKFAAELLNGVGPGESERVLSELSDEDGDLASKIRDAMFTFEDLTNLPNKALQLLMREVANDTVLLALKTASEEVRERFLSAVSSRAAEQMRDDLTNMAPARLSEVEQAQKEVVECAMQMAEDGRIALPGRGGEEFV